MRVKICPECDYKNVSFTNRCKECNADITEVSKYIIPPPPPETVGEFRARRFFWHLIISIIVLLVFAVVRIIGFFI